ncbi:nucleoside hydrolase [Raoultibacter phocaeensis]|uniref:nucleoside hydrolase n=1 Tax=Raoultibacter phocaeensis TaxID=2479841 RepID=UPI00111A1F10|nr:nucleoside hydrolase [Raoultibacter phocaeensis]
MDIGQRAAKRIIFDSDTTMGLADCDVDDGLAILFAMGYAACVAESGGSGSAVCAGNSTIEGICASYGNNTLDAVYENTHALAQAFHLDVPVCKGAPDKDHPASEAAYFIVERAHANPGELSLAVTGSTTNLKGALALDPDVLSLYREVVLMGGITQTLAFNGTIMDELNLSCDPEATAMIFEAAARGANVVVATANNCLPATFRRDEFLERIATDREGGGVVRKLCTSWFDTMKRWYGLDEFCCWDVLVPAYILMPELFESDPFDVVIDPRLLKAGFLEPGFKGVPTARIATPRIADAKRFCETAYRLWGQAIASIEEQDPLR